jgi:predicted metal-dependent hydrolase
MADQTRKRGTRATFVAGWEFGSLPEDEVLRRGADLFDRHLYWEAHEVWEEVWRRRAGQPDRDFLKGIIQGAAGLWHATQGNYKGAVSVLGRAVDYLAPYRPAREGIDVAALSDALALARDASAEAMITGEAPRLPDIRLDLDRRSGDGGEDAEEREGAR